MEKKVKAGKMSEEEEKKVTQWFQEARSDRSLSKRSMEERYPLLYAMNDSNQKEPQQEEKPQKTEAIVATDSSAVTPLSTATKAAYTESIHEDCEEVTKREKPVAEMAAEFSNSIPSPESPDSPSMQEESASLPDGNDGKQSPVRRVSSKQRRLSFGEYRSVYLPVPKIENRMPVFISASLRDELKEWYKL